ncbi:MAG TPA: hypothetical protein VEA36_03640 [Candidatus Paceibacterota bacterium]|nr:hypothetical protein [Candidatus Paceibacterota bacterium]
MLEGLGWRKNPSEKRMFVDRKTGAPAEKIVQGGQGEVIGLAKTPTDEIDLVQKNEEQWKEAA